MKKENENPRFTVYRISKYINEYLHAQSLPHTTHLKLRTKTLITTAQKLAGGDYGQNSTNR